MIEFVVVLPFDSRIYYHWCCKNFFWSTLKISITMREEHLKIWELRIEINEKNADNSLKKHINLSILDNIQKNKPLKFDISCFILSRVGKMYLPQFVNTLRYESRLSIHINIQKTNGQVMHDSAAICKIRPTVYLHVFYAIDVLQAF